MEQQQRREGRHAALASETRRRVLGLLTESDGPLDAAAVASLIDLHVTTARFHLEQLEGAGLIRRGLERVGQRGRPRVLFTAGPSAREDGAQRQLSQALVGALSEDSDGGRARALRAGEQWSALYVGELDVASDAGAAPLVRILDRLGFDPELHEHDDEHGDDQGDAHVVELKACPFRDDAKVNPAVVCSVHLGLIRGVGRALGHDANEAELRPFVGRELCLVELRGSWAGAARAEK